MSEDTHLQLSPLRSCSLNSVSGCTALSTWSSTLLLQHHVDYSLATKLDPTLWEDNSKTTHVIWDSPLYGVNTINE